MNNYPDAPQSIRPLAERIAAEMLTPDSDFVVNLCAVLLTYAQVEFGPRANEVTLSELIDAIIRDGRKW